MNKYSLKFEDDKLETTFTLEQYEFHKDLIKNIRKVVLIAGVTMAINNYIYGNIKAASVILGTITLFVPLFQLALKSLRHLDALLFILQILLNSIYPILIYLDIQFGAKSSAGDIQLQFWRASIVCCISYSFLVSSKYYLKAIIFIYNICLQLILYYLQSTQFEPYELLYSVIGCSTAFYHCYLHELGLRSYFLLKQEKIILNNNIMTSIKLPIVCCWLRNEILTLKHVNSLGTQLLKIHNQASFTQFIRMFKWENNTMEQFCYELLNNKTADRDKVHTIKGIHNSQRYACYISFYISEFQGILFLNFQNVLKLTQEQILMERIKHLQHSLLELQSYTHRYIELKLNRNRIELSANCQYFVVTAYSLLIKYINIKPVVEINLKDLIDRNCKGFCTSKSEFFIYIEQNCQICCSAKYHMYLLFSNLMIEATKHIRHDKQIFLSINQTFDEKIQAELMNVELAYKGIPIESKQVQVIDQIVQRIGIGTHSLQRTGRLQQYKWQLLKDLRQLYI